MSTLRLYESVHQTAWRLFFGEAPDSRIANSVANNVDIGLYEMHCLYTKDLDVLAN